MNSGSPLILVDGIESSLTQVNPNDIESVSVLKDASSCAIYGATASAGVVLITTKSGKSGDLKVTYNGRGGVAFNTTRTDFVTTGYDYVTLSNEFTKNSPKGYNAWNYTDEEMQMLYDRRFDKTETLTGLGSIPMKRQISLFGKLRLVRLCAQEDKAGNRTQCHHQWWK